MFLVSYYSNMFGRVCISIIGEILMIELREVLMIKQNRLVRNVRSTFMLLIAASSKAEAGEHAQAVHALLFCKALAGLIAL